MPHIVQINVSNGGVPKRAVAEARIGAQGLEGDAVNHPKIHGGPERAVCLYSLERLLALQDEGHPVFPGAIGENLTLTGLDWGHLTAETVLEFGGSGGPLLQLTKPVTPCTTIAAYFKGEKGYRRIDEERRPGWARWYARVLREGRVQPGDAMTVQVEVRSDK
ncbi:MAG: MOSC domain-containing protein [Rhodothermaceae bacterium]|nr:MOSC domain-containing protein [Rhodothermaceae bacterium]